MSAPRASDIAARTGIAQSVIHSKAPKVDNKKAEEARLRLPGSEEEEDGKGPRAGKDGAGKAGGAGESRQAEQQKVRRKRVRLSELSGKKTGKAAETAKTTETQAKEATKEAKAQAQPEEVGRKIAQQKLNEQGKLAETRFLYQQKMAQNPQAPQGSLTPQGAKITMLNNLIAYQQNNYMQHTGDKAGEIYNRPATRQILTALQGLKSGSTGSAGKSEGTSSSSGSSSSSNVSPGAFKAKTEKANKMLNMFMLADKQPPPGYEPTELVA